MAKALFAIVTMLAVTSPSVAGNFPAERFIQAKLGGKWGMLDQSGKTVLPFIYDFINVDDSGDISLEINKLNGKADARGRIFIPVSYQSVGTFHADGYATASSGGRYGLIDRNNQWVLPAVFSSIDRFDNGILYAARYKGKFGVLSLTDKKWVVAPTFFYIGPLAKNGLAPAKTDQTHAGFINREGIWTIPAGQFDELWEFGDDGLAAAKLDKKWGFIDSSGKWVIKPISEDIIWPNNFNSKGLTFVKIGKYYRLINRSGEFVGSQLYDEVRYFKGGFAQVSIRGKWGLVNEEGKMVLAPTFEAFTDFNQEDLAAAFEGKKTWIIDRKGRRQFGTKFDRVGGFFGGGWAAASVGGRWGAIDVRGNWLIPPKYDCVSICFDDPPPVITVSPMSSD